MPRINVEKPFDFAVNGNHVIEVGVGEQDVSERCALVAVEHLKVATLVEGDPAPPGGDGAKEGKDEPPAGTGDDAAPTAQPEGETPKGKTKKAAGAK